MKRDWARVIWLTVAIGFATSSAGWAESGLEFMYHERAPYYVGQDDGAVGGIIGTRVTKILSTAGIPHFFRRVPANRQLREIERNLRRACALGWFKKPERETFAKFSKPVYRDKPMLMLIRGSEPKTADKTSLAGLSESPELRMGAKLGYSYGPVIDKMIEKLRFSVVTTSQDNVGMLRMLIGKRFDYFLAAAEEVSGILEEVNVTDDNVIAVPLSDSPPGNYRYIMCSKRVDDDLIHRLNLAIGENFE